MEYEIVKKLIKEKRINKDNCMKILKFFLLNIFEETLDQFVVFSKWLTIFYSTQVYNFFVTIIAKYKKKLDMSTKNLERIYYCESRFYLVINDRIRCMEIAYKILELDDLDNLYKYHAYCFIVNCLFGEKLYKESLNENNKLINSVVFSSVSDIQKLIVILNCSSLNAYNKNFNLAIYYDNFAKKFITKNYMDESAIKLYNLIHTLVLLYIGDSNFTHNEMRKCANKYFQDSKSSDFIESLYSNFSVHSEILEILLNLGRKYEVKQLCVKCFKMTSKELIEANLYKIYLKCLDKNDDEYVPTLINYIVSLENIFKSRSKDLKTFYTSYNLYNTITTEYTKLENDYNHDPLTKCFSRAKFEKIKLFTKFGSLIYFDINNFKKINDKYGHAYGDEFLAKFVENVFKVAPHDHLYRLGGDEFVLISMDKDKNKIKNKVINLDNMPLFNVLKHDKFSAGIIINSGDYSVIEATNKADVALYESKRSENGFYKFCK